MSCRHILRFMIVLVITIALSGCNKGQIRQIEETSPPTSMPPTPTPSASHSSTPSDLLDEPTYVPEAVFEEHDLEWARMEFDKHFFEPTIIEPIHYMITKQIGRDMNEFTFILHGFYGYDDGFEQNMINSIEIREISGDYYQKIEGLSTSANVYWEDYGFLFEDWNNDGFLDLQLHEYEGGTMRNEPSRFWLWNNSQKIYKENEQLAEISESSGVYMWREEDDRVRSYTRIGPQLYVTFYYEYKNEEFIEVEREEIIFEIIEKENYAIKKIYKLIDGEMKLVEETKTKLDD